MLPAKKQRNRIRYKNTNGAYRTSCYNSKTAITSNAENQAKNEGTNPTQCKYARRKNQQTDSKTGKKIRFNLLKDQVIEGKRSFQPLLLREEREMMNTGGSIFAKKECNGLNQTNIIIKKYQTINLESPCKLT